MNKKLVAYFSATGITEKVAKELASIKGADIYEIKPKIPYTKADLDWMDKQSRSSVEMNDKSYRPEIIGENINIEDYDVVFLGFPIWWYVAPTIINTFLEAYDFSNKKIVIFATSGSSGFGQTVKNLKNSVSDSTEIIEGKVFNKNSDMGDLKSWSDVF